MKYGFRMGDRLIVLNANSAKKAVAEINKLLKGPLELIRTDYQQAEVGLKMATEKVCLISQEVKQLVLRMDGAFEERPLLQISDEGFRLIVD